ncbi:MAG: bifunctional diaminohydroxyphosphoribosylaminopyrimidine deaminase/5-amino-6-(5-phosphoribosylamino)uracil reductase RibD [Candidatus Omnitrophica bacterium]|nr:bifunctional diaminohydroxyphosphoribosylaminopyrimidine deaminase/5-amino-6-(5-phosphoribosylamino)uracil reductase RibD [Candidatus Omnitrophota bacterium]
MPGNAELTQDKKWMKLALDQARRAIGRTSPNPMVGAVLVWKGKVIATGFHRGAGRPHAEIEVIRRAKSIPEGTVLYVNLEPCAHYGRTPPCVDQILCSPVRRVVIGTADPNPLVRGKSIRKLRRAGVRVTTGVLAEESRRLNEVFFKNMKASLPFVAAKAAQSLDGRIATRQGHSRWITGARARRHARTLRDRYDAVMVGVGTVEADDPLLHGARDVPCKIVLDPSFRVSAGRRIFSHSPEKVFLVTEQNPLRVKKRLPPKVTVIHLSRRKDGSFSLTRVLRVLYRSGICSVFVEGGGYTLGACFQQKIVDRVYFYYAPKVIGGMNAPGSVGARGYGSLRRVPQIKEITLNRIGQDILCEGTVHYPACKESQR